MIYNKIIKEWTNEIKTSNNIICDMGFGFRRSYILL